MLLLLASVLLCASSSPSLCNVVFGRLSTLLRANPPVNYNKTKTMALVWYFWYTRTGFNSLWCPSQFVVIAWIVFCQSHIVQPVFFMIFEDLRKCEFEQNKPFKYNKFRFALQGVEPCSGKPEVPHQCLSLCFVVIYRSIR